MEASAQLVRMNVERHAGDCTKGARARVRGGAHPAKGGPSGSDSNGPLATAITGSVTLVACQREGSPISVEAALAP